jgi:hypothetical protein
MAKPQETPNQSVEATDRSKAGGERDTAQESARDTDRDTAGEAPRPSGRHKPEASGRDHLDPIELRDLRDETAEKHRRGEDVGASGISNRTLAEEEEEQAEVPPRNTTKKAGGA